MEKDKKQINPRDHLANERTFLAWIRTSISIIAFGLAVFKFTLFEKYSSIVDVIIEAVGVVTTVLPYIYYNCLTTYYLNEEELTVNPKQILMLYVQIVIP